ncbi:MAG: TatD family hydrolase [Gammaproteobacteria bacterium]|nr:MAG: TatD family hydrolase [Gammaproteobacteria bacterium]
MPIDIGANLAHASFSHDLDAVIRNAISAGVHCMIVTGSCKESSLAALDLARRYRGTLFATAGVHPHMASSLDDACMNVIRECAEQPEVVAIGEMGLDYHRNYSPRANQDEAFERQLELATGFQKPLFLHQRDAHQRFLEILKPCRDHFSAAVAHCFTGTEQEMKDYLDLDLHIGITGWICDERRGHHLREFIHQIPADRLMIETDAPYLLPRDLDLKPKQRRNEPKYLPHILQTVADAVGKPIEQVREETTRTTRAFFKLKEPC